MPARDFDLARRERAAKRTPVEFLLGGERFTLMPTVPLGAAFDLHDAPEPEDDQATAVRAICGFIAQSIVPADVERWEQLLKRRDDPIDPEAIVEVGTFITEHYTGRPTVPSSGSSGGRHTSGPTSKKRGRKAASSAT